MAGLHIKQESRSPPLPGIVDIQRHAGTTYNHVLSAAERGESALLARVSAEDAWDGAGRMSAHTHTNMANGDRKLYLDKILI